MVIVKRITLLRYVTTSGEKLCLRTPCMYVCMHVCIQRLSSAGQQHNGTDITVTQNETETMRWQSKVETEKKSTKASSNAPVSQQQQQLQLQEQHPMQLGVCCTLSHTLTHSHSLSLSFGARRCSFFKSNESEISVCRAHSLSLALAVSGSPYG